MDASTTTGSSVAASELRQRLPLQPEKPQRAKTVEEARRAVVKLNAAEDQKEESERRTFGRTADGTVFTVPTTHDMVSQLFSPTEPKNLSDVVVIVVLALHVLPLLVLPTSFSIPLFAVVYLSWRAAYNGGIGFLLWHQSNYNALVAWTKRTGIFTDPAKGKNDFARWYPLLKREMETKIPKDYKFEEAPVEYNTWLLFRRVVDLILMADFTSYVCFAAACGGRPEGEHVLMSISRWGAGWALVLFNLWVKLDAHRVVKDFAWYWGDFFFLIDQELTFDGVFELAPHPMYSVGYAGYYGISLMAASYKVLFISVIAHAAQFAFLLMVENPHIEKTYNPVPPRQHVSDGESILTSSAEIDPNATNPKTADYEQPSHIRDMIGFENIDLHRIPDVSTLLMQFYLYSMVFLTPSTPLYRFFFVANAAIWRLWYSIGIGYILDRQSKKKSWTRHFIKWGETTEEGWRQWKSIYHLSMTMCYASFVAAAYKMYAIPTDWEYGASLLRHVLGAALISLQLWTVVSIYDSLGDFGWFFGDFFYERGPKLTYGGIYRFLNQPERVIGLAGVWGFALITWSKSIFFLALLSHGLTLCFIQFVERPHMHRRYGQSLRGESGVSKNFKRSLPPPLQRWQGHVDKAIDDAAESVDAFLEEARPRIVAYIARIANETRNALTAYPSRMNITRLAPVHNLASLDSKDYLLELLNKPMPPALQPSAAKTSEREGLMARQPAYRGSDLRPMMVEYGEPLHVKWTAPLPHSKRDWVGLYMIADNGDKQVTRVSSQGRWIATTKGAYESARTEQGLLISDKQTIKWEGGQGKDRGTPLVEGEMEFSGDKYWWTTGVFEFRYHHDGMHNIMARSRPFEVSIARFDDQDVPSHVALPASPVSVEGRLSPISSQNPGMRAAVEKALLPMVRNCFDRDPEIAPNSSDQAFGGLVDRDGKFANRVVFAVWQMFGIELAPAVVKADGNVRNLAWRIVNAKQVLAPYSMASNGPSTPEEEHEKVLS